MKFRCEAANSAAWLLVYVVSHPPPAAPTVAVPLLWCCCAAYLKELRECNEVQRKQIDDLEARITELEDAAAAKELQHRQEREAEQQQHRQELEAVQQQHRQELAAAQQEVRARVLGLPQPCGTQNRQAHAFQALFKAVHAPIPCLNHSGSLEGANG